MCGSKAPPQPQAPPAPVPQRDAQIDARVKSQTKARRAATGATAQSTMLTGGGGVDAPAPTLSPVLGG